MKKPILFLIPLFITIPCLAQSQEAGINSVQVAPDYFEPNCLNEFDPEYSDWIEWGRPECWCYPRQCYGDINGASFFGKPVTLSDLAVFKAAFNKTNEQLRLVPDGICADLNHSSFFGKRVTLSDMITFKEYFNLPESQVPDCFWDPWP